MKRIKYVMMLLLSVIIVDISRAEAEEIEEQEEVCCEVEDTEAVSETPDDIITSVSEEELIAPVEEGFEQVNPETDSGFARVAASPYTCGDNIMWSLAGDVLNIIGTGDMYDYEHGDHWRIYTDSDMTSWTDYTARIIQLLIKPGVTSIGDNAFQGLYKMTDAVIPDGIRRIGKNAFYGCSKLTKIRIPESVKSIGESAFCQCEEMTNANLPSGITSVSNSLFMNCFKLKSIVIPDGVTKIGRGAFFRCEEIKDIVLPESLTKIDSEAFECCMALKDLRIPEGVSEIKSNAFERCLSLKSIKLPSRLTAIERNLFYRCESLEEVKMGNGVTKIGEDAFQKCKELKDITLSDHLREIYDGAFAECSSLTSIVIPRSVYWIGQYAFYRCSNLTDVYFGGTEREWKSIIIKNNNEPLLTAKIHYSQIQDTTLEKVTLTGLYNSNKGADLRWKADPEAERYDIYRTNGGKTVKIATVGGSVTSYIDSSIRNNCWGKVYVYYVRSIRGDNTSPKGEGMTLQRLAPMNIVNCKNDKTKSVTVIWNISSGTNKANGYELQYAESEWELYKQKGTFKKTTISGRNNLSKLVSGLGKGKTYYFRVRAYVYYRHSVTGITTKTWSQYSNVVSAKILR